MRHGDSSRKQFEAHGFAHLSRHLTPDDLQVLEQAHLELSTKAHEMLRRVHAERSTLAELYRHGSEKLIVVPERDRPLDLCRLEYLCGAHSAIRQLVEKCITPAVEAVLGEKCVLFKDKCNEKAPGGGAFPPHQDMAAYHVFAPRYFITAMVALDQATKANGCLYFARNYKRLSTDGSAVEFDVCGLPVFKFHHQGPDNGNIHEHVAAQFEWEAVPAREGDLVIFDAFVPHRSEPNKTEASRRALFFTYNRGDDGGHYETYYREKRNNYDSPVFHVATPTDHAAISATLKPAE